MDSIQAQIEKQVIEFNCPECDFISQATIKQVKVQDVIICRGCKSNINLIDNLGSAKKAIHSITKAIDGLQDQLSIFFK